MGEFVYLNEPNKRKRSGGLCHKKAYPKQVGIIIDGDVGSTAEQFVLAARQSKKVKFFGTPTFGALDISNMYSTKDPCNEYELGYCLSHSRRIPQYILDDRGLRPDYFISNEIAGFKWVTYVKKFWNSSSMKRLLLLKFQKIFNELSLIIFLSGLHHFQQPATRAGLFFDYPILTGVF